MDSREFKGSLIKEKKKRFILAVSDAATRLGVKQPVVKIWECPYEAYNPDEIAHCHHDMRMICISEGMLERRSFEDLIETATHEVSHLLHPNHGDSFHRTHQSLKEAAWSPPTGVGITAFSEADLNRPLPKYKPSKPDTKHCNYYQASSHAKGKLETCKYCKRSFCKDHVKARQAGIVKLGDPTVVDAANPHTHPCMSYLDSKKSNVPIIGASKGGCSHCGAHMHGLPHDCKFCKKLFCDKHRLPEDHECPVLEDRKARLSPGRVIEMRSSPTKSSETEKYENHKKKRGFSHLTRRYLGTDHINDSKHSQSYSPRGTSNYEPEKEMYHPGHGGFNFNFRNPFRNLFSFTLHYEIKRALSPFFVTVAIGLVLDYIYYHNLSPHYLFIQGVQEWFSTLISIFNNNFGGGYDLLYVVINGIYYWYLYSYSVKLAYATVTNLNKRGTIMFLLGIAVALFVIFKYFPQVIY